MNKRIFAVILLTLSLVAASGQDQVKRKGNLFFYWGYNRSAYTESDFHVSGEGYDLTFESVRAKDKPTPFSFNDYVKPANISKPQYNYRLGYFITDRLSVSIGMDHMKYFMIEDQLLKVSGHVDAEANTEYAGTYDQTELVVPWRLLWVHHSDGLNYASAEVEYNHNLWSSKNQKFGLDVLGNVGVGLVVPKTYVKVLNEGVDNRFHVAGGGLSIKVGGRFTFWNYLFAEVANKNGYVWMPDILVNNEQSAKASQHFGWTQFYGAIGFSLPLKHKAKKNDTTQ